MNSLQQQLPQPPQASQDDIKVQRRIAYDTLSVPLERLSVKQLMEFKLA